MAKLIKHMLNSLSGAGRFNLITEKVYFSMKTASVIMQQNIQSMHTRWNAHIEFQKIHLAYQAHESTHKLKCT